MVHQVNIARSEADAQEPKSHGKGCNENTYTIHVYMYKIICQCHNLYIYINISRVIYICIHVYSHVFLF